MPPNRYRVVWRNEVQLYNTRWEWVVCVLQQSKGGLNCLKYLPQTSPYQLSVSTLHNTWPRSCWLLFFLFNSKSLKEWMLYEWLMVWWWQYLLHAQRWEKREFWVLDSTSAFSRIISEENVMWESQTLSGHLLEADSCPWNHISQVHFFKRLSENTYMLE